MAHPIDRHSYSIIDHIFCGRDEINVCYVLDNNISDHRTVMLQSVVGGPAMPNVVSDKRIFFFNLW